MLVGATETREHSENPHSEEAKLKNSRGVRLIRTYRSNFNLDFGHVARSLALHRILELQWLRFMLQRL